MSRYYFDFVEDGLLQPDDDGLELSDDRRALTEGQSTLATMLRDRSPIDGRLVLEFRIRTPAGAILVTRLVSECSAT